MMRTRRLIFRKTDTKLLLLNIECNMICFHFFKIVVTYFPFNVIPYFDVLNMISPISE